MITAEPERNRSTSRASVNGESHPALPISNRGACAFVRLSTTKRRPDWALVSRSFLSEILNARELFAAEETACENSRRVKTQSQLANRFRARLGWPRKLIWPNSRLGQVVALCR